MDIEIIAAGFQCTTPTLGTTYRVSGRAIFRLNYTSDWDVYSGLGLATSIRLYYEGDGNPEEEYTLSTLPANATDFDIILPLNYDVLNFRIEFLIDDGITCSNIFTILNANIVLI